MNLLTHHAQYIVGSISERDGLIGLLAEVHGIARQANPDFFDLVFETLTIDDARELRSLHAMRPMGESGKKIFVVTISNATVEAQNALLKLLEEPAEYAHFFIVIPSAHLLLPTVRSRMVEVGRMEHGVRSVEDGVESRRLGTRSGAESGTQTNVQKEAEVFLKMSMAKRLEYIKKLTDDISKEKKTKRDAIELLDAVQAAVYRDKGIKQGRDALESIEKARSYMSDRAPSMKMLLESVAMAI